MMSSDELRRTLSTLDEIEPAPQDLVDRVWADVAGLLDDADDRTVVRIMPPAPATPGSARSLALVAASVVAVIALGVVVLGVARSTDRRALSDPSSTVSSTVDAAVAAPPTTRPAVREQSGSVVGEVCLAFASAGEVPQPLVLDGTTDDVALLGAWSSYVAALVAAVDDLAPPAEADDQVRSLRLLRSALASAQMSAGDVDVREFETIVDNIGRHLDAATAGPLDVASCLQTLTVRTGS